MNAWHWIIIAAATGTAVLWLWLAWSRPAERYRGVTLWRLPKLGISSDYQRKVLDAIDAEQKRRAAWQDEIGDPTRAQIDQALDELAEPDRRRAEHMNRTLRRAEGGDEHG